MKTELSKILEQGRLTSGRMASNPNSGPNGFFIIKGPKGSLSIISSNGTGWEHVSISTTKDKKKIPSWKEMCFVKELFWEDDECVIQYHPKKTEYINIHSGVLHLWKPINQEIPMPPLEMV